MFEAEQQLAPAREAKKSWGEAAATPETCDTFSRLPAGIQTLVGVPMRSAVSTLPSVPRGTTMMSAPRRSAARRRLVLAPCTIKTVERPSPAMSSAQAKISQLRRGLREMFLRARVRRLMKTILSSPANRRRPPSWMGGVPESRRFSAAL